MGIVIVRSQDKVTIIGKTSIHPLTKLARPPWKSDLEGTSVNYTYMR